MPSSRYRKNRQCQILYDDLDYQTKTLLENMCQGEFFQKDGKIVWGFRRPFNGKPVGPMGHSPVFYFDDYKSYEII